MTSPAMNYELLIETALDYRMTNKKGIFHHAAAVFIDGQLIEDTLAINDENGHAEEYALSRAVLHNRLKPRREPAEHRQSL